MGYLNNLYKIFKGTVAGDGTGTPARTAAQGLNDNADAIDNALAAIDTAAEKKVNKVPNLDAVNDTTYPTSKAVKDYSDGKEIAANNFTSSQLGSYQAKSEKGIASGYAGLDANALVPAVNLPAFVDEILEGQYIDATTFNDDEATPAPYTPASGKLYVDKVAVPPKIYRWGGSVYAEIVGSPGSTDVVAEGTTNLYFSGARVLATVLAGLDTLTALAVNSGDTILVGIGKLQAQFNTISTSIGNKLDKGTYTGNAGDLKSLIDAKETPLGAQSKADTAETNAKAYADTLLKETIAGRYATYAAMIADQVNQVSKGVYAVADASGFSTVDAGYADFEYLGTTLGTEADYRKLSEEESMDIVSGSSFKTDVEAAGTKASPIDADLFGYLNSAAANALVKFTWANIKAALKTYFDGVYVQTVTGTAVDNTDPNNPVINSMGSEGGIIIEPDEVNVVTPASAPLTIPTFDGSGQTTHPSVLYIPKGLSGYKYWMVHTPYPNANAAFEIPSVVASNDRIKWVEPAGITNPIVPANPDGQIADACIMKGEDGLLYVFYPKETHGVMVVSSADGITWSAETFLHSGLGVWSPTVFWDENRYVMYYSNDTSKEVRIITSDFPDSGWNLTPSTCNLINLPTGWYVWHLEVRKYYGRYIMFANTKQIGSSSGYRLHMATSLNGIDFTFADNPLILPEQAAWTADRLYRASGVMLTENRFALWYGGVSATNVWKIGYTEINLDNTPEEYSLLKPDYGFALSDENSALIASSTTPVYTDYLPKSMVISHLFLNVGSQVPTGDKIEVDLNKNGVSIFTTKPTIDIGGETTLTASIQQVISNPYLIKGDKIEVFITKVGTTNTGKGLKAKIL